MSCGSEKTLPLPGSGASFIMPAPVGSRQLKVLLRELLGRQSPGAVVVALSPFAPRRLVGPLQSLMCDGDAGIKWRAVSVLGRVIAGQVHSALADARISMRRLMWLLNDESGGIGWGAPEAMGDAMARSPLLTGEYASILVSYADPEGNFLEHPGLQRGVLWALGRMAHVRAGAVVDAGRHLPGFLTAADPVLRGLSAWAAGPLRLPALGALLEALVSDPAVFDLYLDERLQRRTVGQVARQALEFSKKHGATT